MARVVRRNLVGTKAQFDATIRKRYPDVRIVDGADVYWDRSGILFLVAPEAWVDYLSGRSGEMPEDLLEDTGPFEFDEDEFQNLMKEITLQ